MSSGRVLGVDACKSGWVGIAWTEGVVSAYAAADISGLVEDAAADGPLAVVAIDIPIGLPDTGRRQADVLARKAVGPLRSSVFTTPVRAAMEAPDYAAAAEASRRLAGEGISRQAFALQAKVLQVDRWVRKAPYHVVEVHPEASFAELAGSALQSRKSSWAGEPCGDGFWPRQGSAFPATSAQRARKPAWMTCWTLPRQPGRPGASFTAKRGLCPPSPKYSATDCLAPSGLNGESGASTGRPSLRVLGRRSSTPGS